MPESDLPSVAVVIPCYNSELWVSRAIESALRQAGVRPEVIAVDDGSTDNSLQMIRRYSDSIRWESGPNSGACIARNRGLELVKSPFVMFLDADDYLEQDTLLGLVSAAEKAKADLVITKVAEADATGRRASRVLPRVESPNRFMSDWLTGRYVPPCGILWRTDFVRTIGGWNEALRKNQDGELVLRAILRGARISAAETGTSVYWHHNSTDRISNTVSEAKLNDSFGVLRNARAEAETRRLLSDEVEVAFSRATHVYERMAAHNGLSALESEIRKYRASLGWPAFEGEIMHICASRLLGLGRKERLARWFRVAMRRHRKRWPRQGYNRVV